jgi:hypothetical protein
MANLIRTTSLPHRRSSMKKLSVSSIHKFRKHWESVGMQVQLHCKKRFDISRPQPVFNLPNSPSSGKIQLLQAREGLVSDIGLDWKMDNLFYSVALYINYRVGILWYITGTIYSKLREFNFFLTVPVRWCNVWFQPIGGWPGLRARQEDTTVKIDNR